MTQFNLFQQPNAQEALEHLVNEVTQKRERRADAERAKLREERERLLDELAIGVESLRYNVKAAESELKAAKEKVRLASRKKAQAERELSLYEQSFTRRIGRLEAEICKRPMEITTRLFRKLADAKKQLGASPSWGFEPLEKIKKLKLDLSHWRRCDALRRIGEEIQQLDQQGDFGKAELLERAISQRLDLVLRN